MQTFLRLSAVLDEEPNPLLQGRARRGRLDTERIRELGLDAEAEDIAAEMLRPGGFSSVRPPL